MSRHEVMVSIEKMVGKMADPKYKARYADYKKTLQFIFTDDETAICHIIFEGGSATIVEGQADEPELLITTTTETLMAIMNGSLSPTRAFISGKIKTKGPINDLLKLQVLMK